MQIETPETWFNVLADRGLELPPDRSAPDTTGPSGMRTAIPMSLARQSMPLRADVPIPAPVREAYREWRPTPLVRLHRLEEAIGSRARLYMKYEAGNVAGSHKYLTALAQAHYFAAAGYTSLMTSTAAGQWGTAVAAAARRFGLPCTIYMVPGSYDRKPGRLAAMRMLGATVLRGRPGAAAATGRDTSLSDVMAEARERADGSDGAAWILGGSEPFAILHTTVVGEETRRQLAGVESATPVLVGYLGGGKNVGGLGLPFLRDGADAEIVAVESTAYPVLTRGEYRYDRTTRSGVGSEAKMYTLGQDYPGAPIQAEGMRYHAAPKLFSLLHDQGLVRAMAFDESPVFASARLLLQTEGWLPSAEASYAVHAACELARDEAYADRPIVFCVSDHGFYDGDAYLAYLDGDLAEPVRDPVPAGAPSS